jgi:hypothetical protein
VSRPRFQVVSPDATPEEVAAIAAAFAVVEQERAAAARAAEPEGACDPEHLDAWVQAARLSGRRAGLMRGSWRLSGRIDRRSRA